MYSRILLVFRFFTMFGYLAAGRLPCTQVSQVSESLFLMQLEAANSINHLCVFMTGSTPFSEGIGGSIHIGWPTADQVEPLWQYMGFISNEKPSAIFRITRAETGTIPGTIGNLASNIPQNLSLTTALIGISVEPIVEISNKIPVEKSLVPTIDYKSQFITKMLDSFVNFALSFEVPVAAINPMSGGQYIPSSVVKQWIEKFQTRVNLDPEFWMK
eukprot:TRINITY_DN11969_c0_g1_i1.p1 TRINITY_DN11969_c0_g1~~TRINITY_DN11969_c0_g1_i1.p1  ORF type:complete len:215 (+),score=28.62 TRINITY_DN11969_c0_g1_i1:97-741(+)